MLPRYAKLRGRFYLLRYATLVGVVIAGVYNVDRAALAGFPGSCFTYERKEQTYRNGRHPLRPWTEKEWVAARDRPDFRVPRKEARCWTETIQSDIGDESVQCQRRPKNKWGEDPLEREVTNLRDANGRRTNGVKERKVTQTVYAKSSAERERELGTISKG